MSVQDKGAGLQAALSSNSILHKTSHRNLAAILCFQILANSIVGSPYPMS